MGGHEFTTDGASAVGFHGSHPEPPEDGAAPTRSFAGVRTSARRPSRRTPPASRPRRGVDRSAVIVALIMLPLQVVLAGRPVSLPRLVAEAAAILLAAVAAARLGWPALSWLAQRG